MAVQVDEWSLKYFEICVGDNLMVDALKENQSFYRKSYSPNPIAIQF